MKLSGLPAKARCWVQSDLRYPGNSGENVWHTGTNTHHRVKVCCLHGISTSGCHMETLVMKKTVQFLLLLFIAFMMVWVSACTPASTSVPSEPPQQITREVPHTVAEVEELAGFNVPEPGYLPAGVSIDSVTYEESPSPAVVLHFKLVDEQYGDMGPFFEIRQEPQAKAPPGALSCGGTAEGCEVLQAGDVPVVYHLYSSPTEEGASTEGLEWYANGSFFRLHRMAGEPDKVYKEELLKVVDSMQ